MAMVESIRSPPTTIQGIGKQENAERFIAVALCNMATNTRDRASCSSDLLEPSRSRGHGLTNDDHFGVTFLISSLLDKFTVLYEQLAACKSHTAPVPPFVFIVPIHRLILTLGYL